MIVSNRPDWLIKGSVILPEKLVLHAALLFSVKLEAANRASKADMNPALGGIAWEHKIKRWIKKKKKKIISNEVSVTNQGNAWDTPLKSLLVVRFSGVDYFAVDMPLKRHRNTSIYNYQGGILPAESFPFCPSNSNLFAAKTGFFIPKKWKKL